MRFKIENFIILFVFISGTIFSGALCKAQSTLYPKSKIIRVPFDAAHFDTSGRKTTFINYEGLQVMKISGSPTRQTTPVTLKNFNFTNGTIEFDGRPADNNYEDEIGINFHQKDIFNYESLYLRTQADETPQRNNAIQYSPYIHGVNLWDLMKPFRGYAAIYNNQWNHFKLVISGMQMIVYINSDIPALKVTRLEGKFATGALSFDGNAMFANLVIKPNETSNLSPAEGLDWTDNDPNYIRKWEVSDVRCLNKNQEITADDLPADTASWRPIISERRGLINLSRRFEGPEFTSYPKSRRYVWLKTIIRADRKLNVRTQLGFNKEVYVFINRKPLYSDKNEAGQLYQKFPGGLLDIANSAFQLPLQQGANELLIAVAVKDYGWGIVARLESLQDLFISK
jgi:hypothetical protein